MKWIYMAYQTLADKNLTDPADLLTYADDITGGIFVPLILFAFFVVICVGGLFAQQRSSGRSDFATWFTVASFLTTILSFMMGLKEGLIATQYQVILIALTALSVFFLWFSSGSNE